MLESSLNTVQRFMGRRRSVRWHPLHYLDEYDAALVPTTYPANATPAAGLAPVEMG